MWREILAIRRWRDLRLTGRFALISGLLLGLIFIMLAAGYVALSAARYEIERAILTNAEIQSVYVRVVRIEQQVQVVLALLALGGSVVVFFANWRLNASILRYIRGMLAAARAFQTGDLDVRVQVEGADELSQLAGAFNAMAAQVQVKVAEMAALNQDLRAGERKYRKLFEDSQDTIALTTLDGSLLDINPAGTRLLGYPQSELLGRNISALLVLPAQYAVFRERFLTVSAFSLETQMMRSDGTVIDVLLNATLQRADDGTPTGFQIILRDLTESLQAEANLRLTQYSVEHSSNMISWVDAEARLKYVNETACASLGYSRPELLTRTLFDINLFWSPKV